MRAFIGIPLASSFRSALIDAGSAIRQSDPRWTRARWVPRENLHITLQFLGDIDSTLAPVLGERLGAELSLAEPTSVTLTGVGALPRVGRARMLWARFGEQDSSVAGLAKLVADVTAELGIESDNRPFETHATLARAEKPQPVAADALAAADESLRSALGQKTVMSVGHATLYKSTLTRTGAVYEELVVMPFGSTR